MKTDVKGISDFSELFLHLVPYRFEVRVLCLIAMGLWRTVHLSGETDEGSAGEQPSEG